MSINGNDQLLSSLGNISENDRLIWRDVFDLTEKTISLFDGCNKKDYDPEGYKKFRKDLRSIIDELNRATDLEKNKQKQFISFFTGKIFTLLSQSRVMLRALTKPFGYPGDYIMMQTLYDNKIVSETTLGKYLDQFFFDDELAKAVVNRVEVMGDRVIDFIKNSQKKELNILNIASGSAFELKKINAQKYGKKINFHCFDQELASLSYIHNNALNVNPELNLKLYKEDIRAFFSNWKSQQKFDFIYNIGLGDYLPDRVLTSLITESLEHLEKEGAFVLAHKDYTKFPYQYPSWTCQWNFIHRNLDEYKSLIKDKINKPFSIWFESEKKVIYFAEFTSR